LGSLIAKWFTRLRVHLLQYRYRNRPYREYYAAVMRVRTAYDPKFAVGGRWEEIGRLQFDFLRARGLQPTHTLLDFGCGSLRGGLHFIRYLEPGHYTGIDISPEALAAGRQFLAQAGLEDRKPVLRLSHGLTFDDFSSQRFDFILAQSVLTHMPRQDIETLFAHVHKVMHPATVFYATFFDGGTRTYTSADRTNFHYPFPLLRDLGAKYSLRITRDPDYPHPRKQQMMAIRLLIDQQ